MILYGFIEFCHDIDLLCNSWGNVLSCQGSIDKGAKQLEFIDRISGAYISYFQYKKFKEKCIKVFRNNLLNKRNF